MSATRKRPLDETAAPPPLDFDAAAALQAAKTPLEAAEPTLLSNVLLPTPDGKYARKDVLTCVFFQ